MHRIPNLRNTRDWGVARGGAEYLLRCLSRVPPSGGGLCVRLRGESGRGRLGGGRPEVRGIAWGPPPTIVGQYCTLNRQRAKTATVTPGIWVWGGVGGGGGVVSGGGGGGGGGWGGGVGRR